MNAAESYSARLAEVRDLIRRLEGSLAIHERRQSARPGDWGFPGDLAHIAERLREIIAEPHRPPVRVEAPEDLRRVRGLLPARRTADLPRARARERLRPERVPRPRDGDARRPGLTGAPRSVPRRAVRAGHFGRDRRTQP